MQNFQNQQFTNFSRYSFISKHNRYQMQQYKEYNRFVLISLKKSLEIFADNWKTAQNIQIISFIVFTNHYDWFI